MQPTVCPSRLLPNPSLQATGVVLLVAGIIAVVWYRSTPPGPPAKGPKDPPRVRYVPRQRVETSGVIAVFNSMKGWPPTASLEECAAGYDDAIPRGLTFMDKCLETGAHEITIVLLQKAALFHARGDPDSAYKTLEELEARIKGTDLEAGWLYTLIFYKGVSALRAAENDNCLMCRGESACIYPILPAAVHKKPEGARRAIRHFTDYLREFPDDLEVKWLLNLSHMTLGEYPDKIDPAYRLPLDGFFKSEFHLGGVNRLNQSGGAIMEDFDNDGLLDLVVTAWSPSEPMAFYRNKGDGTFEDRTKAAGLSNQMGGLYCVQADYDNDGHMDIFVPRGSWMPAHCAQRPSLLRNNGNGTFTDVTAKAGLLAATNSVSAAWADFDNDGHLDLFICCHHRPSLLYRNKGDGTFEEVAARVGLGDLVGVLGVTWIDFDNDGYPDLFVGSVGNTGNTTANNTTARLYRNNRNGTFTDVTQEMGIDGPTNGFSCWAFDFDNDSWLERVA